MVMTAVGVAVPMGVRMAVIVRAMIMVVMRVVV